MIAIMTQGGPWGSTNVLAYFMFEQALSEYGYRMGYGSAIATVLFGIMLIYITFFILRMYRDEKEGCNICSLHQLPKASPLSLALAIKIAVPIALIIWLIPLLGVMMTALRGAGDITAGNLWGVPSNCF